MNEWKAEWRRDELPRLSEGGAEREAFYHEVEEVFFDWGGAWSPHAWEEMRPLLEEMVRLCRAHGAEPVWLAFPTRQQVEASFDASQPQQHLAELASQLGAPLLDLLPVLRDLRRRSDGPIFYDQCHHTAAASRVLARAIFERLRQI